MRARGSVACDGGADLLQQLAVGLQTVPFEIAQDEVELGRRRCAAHLVEVDESLAVARGLRRQRDVGQRVDDLGGQVQGIDQDVLGLAGVGGHALDGHDRLVRRERLVDDLAELGAVQRVGDVGLQVVRQIGVDAAADLLVRREADPDRAVGEVRVAAAGGGP